MYRLSHIKRHAAQPLLLWYTQDGESQLMQSFPTKVVTWEPPDIVPLHKLSARFETDYPHVWWSDIPAAPGSTARHAEGTPHRMNWPAPLVRPVLGFLSRIDRLNTIAICSASFVSGLINGQVATEEALPLSKYFIWNDDVEYISRLLKFGDGHLFPEYIVVHASDRKYTSPEESGDSIFFATRNQLGLIFRNSGLFTPSVYK